jgi:hypothetical protein
VPNLLKGKAIKFSLNRRAESVVIVYSTDLVGSDFISLWPAELNEAKQAFMQTDQQSRRAKEPQRWTFTISPPGPDFVLKNITFFSLNTGTIPLQELKAEKPDFMVLEWQEVVPAEEGGCDVSF